MIEEITSVANPKIKDLLLLQEKSKVRRERNLFVVEGVRELHSAMEGGFEVVTIFFCPDIFSLEAVSDCLADNKSARAFSVSTKVYQKIAYRDSTEGIVAIFRAKQRSLEQLKLSPTPLILVLESIEKPGNLGAVLRTADAAGVDAVIVCDAVLDLYNPNLIRASLGGIFTLQVVSASSTEAINWLRANGISILTAQLQDSTSYYQANMKEATAIVFGAESTGLSQQWRDTADQKINIPMLGKLDSLNISVSAAILCYEAVRQRTPSMRRSGH